MATAYKSTRAATGQSAKSRTGQVTDYCEFTVPAAGFVINDTVKLFLLPMNARILEFTISLPILDSNGAPATVLAVGDTQNGATYYVSSANLGTHNSVAVDLVFPGSGSGNQPNTLGVKYTADDALILKVTTAPATAATTGTIRAWICYEMDGGSQSGF